MRTKCYFWLTLKTRSLIGKKQKHDSNVNQLKRRLCLASKLDREGKSHNGFDKRTDRRKLTSATLRFQQFPTSAAIENLRKLRKCFSIVAMRILSANISVLIQYFFSKNSSVLLLFSSCCIEATCCIFEVLQTLDVLLQQLNYTLKTHRSEFCSDFP